MSLRIGMDVYCGWCPTAEVEGDDPRCSIATITDGPYDGYNCGIYQVVGRAWGIRHADGGDSITAERLLLPFNPPDREVCVDDCLSLTE